MKDNDGRTHLPSSLTKQSQLKAYLLAFLQCLKTLALTYSNSLNGFVGLLVCVSVLVQNVIWLKASQKVDLELGFLNYYF